MSLRQMSVGARLGLGFGIVVVLLVAVAVTAIVRLSAFNRNVEALATVRLVQLVTVGQASSALGDAARSTGNVLVLDDEAQVKGELASIRQNREHVQELLVRVGKTVAPGRERDLFDAIQAARTAYLPHETEFLQHGERGDYSSAKDVLLKSVRPAQLKLEEAMDAFDQFQVSLSADEARIAAEAYEVTRASIAILALLAVVLGTVAGLLIIRGLRAELGGEPAYAKEVASRIADGDLTLDVQVRPGDTGSMLFAMKQMVENLRQLVGEVAGGAATVSDTSAQIAQGNLDLSQRTEEQASSLEETASSLEELTSTVNQNADNARQASVLAVSASDVARRGGAAVGEVVSTMTGISESSRRIGDIIGVIDGIAFQTNILALNAAVEAARAGEQGRGFAVVAAEVRNLAQRSAQAAREIKGLIGESIEKVDAGTRLVDAAGATMEEIVASVKKVSDLIAEIAAASQEQSSGIAQVNSAITQMDSVVQQNASLVEEATAATESMKSQAGALLQMVARFSLGDQAQAYVQPSAPPAPPAARAAPPALQRRAPAMVPVFAGAQGATPRAGAGQWTEF